MAVRDITVVSGGTTRQEVVQSTRSIVVSNTSNTVQQGTGATATEVVRPGGTVSNVAWGSTLPPNPTEGQIFILVT